MLESDKLYVSKFTMVVVLGFGYLIYAASGGGSGPPPKELPRREVLRQAACNEQSAARKLENARQKQVIEKVTVFNNEVSVIMDSTVWRRSQLNAKMGLIEAVDCAVAGEKGRLRAVIVLSPTGERLGSWDGIGQKLEVD